MLPDSPSTSPGLRSALAILARLADSGGLPFTRLRREVSLPAATVSRLLKVLAEEGWVAGGAQEPWRPGPAFRAAAWRLAPRSDLAHLVQPVVEDLAEGTGESAAFVEWGGDGIVFRAKAERPESYHYLGIGERNRGVLEHPFALLCLAHCDEAAVRRYASAARKAGMDLSILLPQIREAGVHSGMNKGWRIAAPVVAHGGAFLGAVGITHLGSEPEPRLVERFKRLVVDHARRAATLIDQTQ